MIHKPADVESLYVQISPSIIDEGQGSEEGIGEKNEWEEMGREGEAIGEEEEEEGEEGIQNEEDDQDIDLDEERNKGDGYFLSDSDNGSVISEEGEEDRNNREQLSAFLSMGSTNGIKEEKNREIRDDVIDKWSRMAVWDTDKLSNDKSPQNSNESKRARFDNSEKDSIRVDKEGDVSNSVRNARDFSTRGREKDSSAKTILLTLWDIAAYGTGTGVPGSNKSEPGLIENIWPNNNPEKNGEKVEDLLGKRGLEMELKKDSLLNHLIMNSFSVATIIPRVIISTSLTPFRIAYSLLPSIPPLPSLSSLGSILPSIPNTSSKTLPNSDSIISSLCEVDSYDNDYKRNSLTLLEKFKALKQDILKMSPFSPRKSVTSNIDTGRYVDDYRERGYSHDNESFEQKNSGEKFNGLIDGKYIYIYLCI
jgi:hypothetical protein